MNTYRVKLFKKWRAEAMMLARLWNDPRFVDHARYWNQRLVAELGRG